jgi:hypothetical protein
VFGGEVTPPEMPLRALCDQAILPELHDQKPINAPTASRPPAIEQDFGFVVFLDEDQVFAIAAPVGTDAGEDVDPAGVLHAADGWSWVQSSDLGAIARPVDPYPASFLPSSGEDIVAGGCDAACLLAGSGGEGDR